MNKYLVHYLLESKQEGFKHKHRALEVETEIPSVSTFYANIITRSNALLTDYYDVIIVGWNKI